MKGRSRASYFEIEVPQHALSVSQIGLFVDLNLLAELISDFDCQDADRDM